MCEHTHRLRNAGGGKHRIMFHIVMELPEAQSLGTQYYSNTEQCNSIQPAPPPSDISREVKKPLQLTGT